MNITSPNLTFSVIMEEDQGMYRCVVTNDDGSIISDSVNITVQGKLWHQPFLRISDNYTYSKFSYP